jgi:hypothetical protein
VHPEPVGYDELLDRTLRYGRAIREADPQAKIAGPASWGWPGYFYSAKDAQAGFTLHPDRRAHAGMPLLAWYLSELARHERAEKTRVLDLLDVHFYPQAHGVYTNGPEAAATAALRIRSTRALWDASYVDESWINEPIQLLPRLKRLVAENYPGRGIVLGEWSFGGEQHVSGALATAEALGRFGQAGVDAAFYWLAPPPGSPTFWAFRAYRNYDGKGARFLDLSLDARGSSGLSAFASRNAEGSRFVLILLNLEPDTALRPQLAFDSCGALKVQRSFSYGGGKDGLRGPSSSLENLAPYSLEVVELSRD